MSAYRLNTYSTGSVAEEVIADVPVINMECARNIIEDHGISWDDFLDGFGSRLGKSGASVVHQSFIMIFGSISLSAPLVGGVLLIVIGGWIAATRLLGKEFHKLTLGHETLEITDEEPKVEEREPALASTE